MQKTVATGKNGPFVFTATTLTLAHPWAFWPASTLRPNFPRLIKTELRASRTIDRE